MLPETLLPHNLQPLTPEQGIVSERHYEVRGAGRLEGVGGAHARAAPPPPWRNRGAYAHTQLLGATEFRLSNGMTVYIKQTSFLEDELLMTGCAAGGLSEVRTLEREGPGVIELGASV